MRRCTRFIFLATLLGGCDHVTDPASGATGTDAFAPLNAASSAVSVSAKFHEPLVPRFRRGDCSVAPEGVCASGQVDPFGKATETVEFGAACGGGCDLRILYLAQGTIVLQETFSDPVCPGACAPNPAEPLSGSLTDVILSGTGLFQGATGVLTGTVRASGPESVTRLSGTIVLASGG